MISAAGSVDSTASAVPRSARPASAVAPTDISARSAKDVEGEAPRRPGKADSATAEAASGRASETGAAEMSEADRKRLRELQERDREVRAHEQAHLAAAGSYARGAATYTYERGPDQRMYAVGGEVKIDTAPVPEDPEATLRKAQVIRRAALAPANPSAQDRAVAAEASRMAAEAQAEITADAIDGSGDAHGARSPDGALDGASDGLATCPACGGAHASHAHEGMTAYAATAAAAQSGPPLEVSTSV